MGPQALYPRQQGNLPRPGPGLSFMEVANAAKAGYQLGQLIKHERDRPSDEEMAGMFDRAIEGQGTFQDYSTLAKYDQNALTMAGHLRSEKLAQEKLEQQQQLQQTQNAILYRMMTETEGRSQITPEEEQAMLGAFNVDPTPDSPVTPQDIRIMQQNVATMVQLRKEYMEVKERGNPQELEYFAKEMEAAGAWAMPFLQQAERIMVEEGPQAATQYWVDEMHRMKGESPEQWNQLASMPNQWTEIGQERLLTPNDIQNMRLNVQFMLGHSEKAARIAMQQSFMARGDLANAYRAEQGKDLFSDAGQLQSSDTAPYAGRDTQHGAGSLPQLLTRPELNEMFAGRPDQGAQAQRFGGAPVMPENSDITPWESRVKKFYGGEEPGTRARTGGKGSWSPAFAVDQVHKAFTSKESSEGGRQQRMMKALKEHWLPEDIDDETARALAQLVLEQAEANNVKSRQDMMFLMQAIVEQMQASQQPEQ